ncbi:CoA transferase [Pseudarthrobacter equi]|uniref:CoA transferase n=1 Tax=Pseudarthrobacter equi TaxID=728066 RepID=UPI000B81B3DA|nr:CoA transferase [Pseudarthrobacter equi]
MHQQRNPAPTRPRQRQKGPLKNSWCRIPAGSFAVDLKTAQGLEAVNRLAATADIVVENFRPGTAASRPAVRTLA